MAIEIYDWDDLDDVRLDVTESYVLMNDLTSSTSGYSSVASSTANSGAGWSPITSFSGTFDGADYEIQSMYIENNSTTYMAFFGTLSTGAEIKNVKLFDITFYEKNSRVGGLVGLISAVNEITIDNCHVTGVIELFPECTAGRAGAIVAFMNVSTGGAFKSTIKNCTSSADVKYIPTSGVNNNSNILVGGFGGHLAGDVEIDNCHVVGNPSVRTQGEKLGGFAGAAPNNIIIKNCSAEATVLNRRNNNGWARTGGFVGDAFNATFDNCFSNSSVSYSGIGQNSSIDAFGGFCGQLLNGTISNCYSIGSMSIESGADAIGGFVGLLGSNFPSGTGTTLKCYASMSMSGVGISSGTYVGGFSGTGYSDAYVTEDSFWNTTVSGLSTSFTGTGKTTTEMRDIDTYTDTATAGLDEAWSMTTLSSHNGESSPNLWAIDDGNAYPILWYEVVPSTGVSVGIKIGGTFEQKPLMIKKSGVFEQVGEKQVGGWSA